MNPIEKINIDDILQRADALIKEGKDFIICEAKVLEISQIADNCRTFSKIQYEYASRFQMDRERNYRAGGLR